MIKRLIITIFLPVLLFALAAPPILVSAASKDDICAGVGQVDGSGNCSQSGASNISNLVKAVVNILSIVVGVAAVIMIIMGGFHYVTSGGDSTKVSSAQQTIIYAIVGLVIVALAQVIVHFTLKKVSLPLCDKGKTQIKIPGDCIVQ